MNPKKRHLPVLLDGYGVAEASSVSTMNHTRKPFLDYRCAGHSHATLKASGPRQAIPQPEAGRVVSQKISRMQFVFHEQSAATELGLL